jgi:hypothetical protein
MRPIGLANHHHDGVANCCKASLFEAVKLFASATTARMQWRQERWQLMAVTCVMDDLSQQMDAQCKRVRWKSSPYARA